MIPVRSILEGEPEECSRPSTSSVSRFPNTYRTWQRCNPEHHIGSKISSGVQRTNGKNGWACRSSNTFPIWPSRAGRRENWGWSSSPKRPPLGRMRGQVLDKSVRGGALAERSTRRMLFWLPIAYSPRATDRET
jgi:hypothetical protein